MTFTYLYLKHMHSIIYQILSYKSCKEVPNKLREPTFQSFRGSYKSTFTLE